MEIIYMIMGLAMLLVGANYLVEASVSLARRVGISSFVIGVTVVGFGTSTPEFVVSLSSALQGHSDLIPLRPHRRHHLPHSIPL